MIIRLHRALLGIVGASALALGCASAPAGGEAIVRTVPFVLGEQLVYSLHNLAGDEVGRGTLYVQPGGNQGFDLVQQFEQVGGAADAATATDHTRLTVDRSTLLPRSLVRAVEGREDPMRVLAVIAEDRSEVTITRGDNEPRTLRLGANAYANESALWLWRTLPLAEDYTQRYVSLDSTEGAVALVSVTVKARERVEVPAGSFDTWRLLVRGGRATGVAWVNVEAPHQVVQWDNGAVMFRLVEIGP